MGPILPYETGNKEAFDHRNVVRNTVGPAQIMPSTYCYQRFGAAAKQERPVTEAQKEVSSSQHMKPIVHCGMAAKLAPDIAITIDSNPFYMTRAVVKKPDHVSDGISIDTNLLQAKAQYGGIGVGAASGASAAHRKVGAVQFGMSRMY